MSSCSSTFYVHLPDRCDGNQWGRGIFREEPPLFFSSCWSMGTLFLLFISLCIKCLPPQEQQKHPHQIQPGPLTASGVLLCDLLLDCSTEISANERIIVLEVSKYKVFSFILQVQSAVPPSAFGVKFHKCAQVHR